MTEAEKEWTKDTYIAELARTGIVGMALRAANVDRTTLLVWQEHDETFSMRTRMAMKEADDNIRSEIRRRAVEGVIKPIYYKGKMVDSIREYSDALLHTLAKSRMPEFREKSEVSVSGSLTVIDVVQRAAEAGALLPTSAEETIDG